MPQKNEPVFGPVLDRLLRLRRIDRRLWIERVRYALVQFSDLDARGSREPGALLRAIVVTDIVVRQVFAFQTRFTRLSAILARFVPIVGRRRLISNASPDRPLILALMHFGPIHLAIAVAMRLLAGRTLYVLHAGGETGHASAAFFTRIGSVPVVTGHEALKFVADAMARNPRTALLLAFDHFGSRGRRTVPLLGTHVEVPTGLGYLARRLDATVVTGWLEWSRLGPRLRIDAAHEIDARVPAHECEGELVDRMYAILERRLKEVPHEWTEWANCYPQPATLPP